MQRIVLLGATGSIGDQTLDIIQRYPDDFQVVGMSARLNGEKLIEQAEKFAVERFYLADGQLKDEREVETVEELVDDSIDHLIVADHGLESFQVVLKALAMKKRVSIANKELIIVHGQDIMYFAREQQAEVIPIDSEHNAIFQCLQGEQMKHVRRIIITASGGPFRDKSLDEMKQVTVDQVLNHPNWDMGSKTTVDSATLVNKAFEVIETHQWFGIPYEQIEVRLHPESIVHAIVEFNDGSSKLLAYPPDMRYAIGYALFYPDRAPADLTACAESYQFDHNLHFERIVHGRFPCFDFVLNTAREKPQSLSQIVANDSQAVDEFLQGKISFSEIYDCLTDGLL